MKTFHRYGANLDGVSADAYVADVLTDECVNFIKKNQEKPWLAVLSHYLVHAPIDPRPEKVPHYKKIVCPSSGIYNFASVIPQLIAKSLS